MRKNTKNGRKTLEISAAKSDVTTFRGNQWLPPNAEMIEFSAPVQIQAVEGEAKGPRRFEMTAYTGGPMRLKGFDYPVVIDLAAMQGIGKPRPVLLDHDTGTRIGHTDRIEVVGGTLMAAGLMSGANAKGVCEEADCGFPWQVSVGARVLKKEFLPAGRSAQVNGQTFEGPIIIARRTSLGEISFTALGADENTSARIAAKAAKGTDMDFDKWIEAKGFALDTLTDASREFLKAQFDAEQTAIKDKEAADLEAKNAKGKKGKKKAKAEDDEDEIEAEADAFDIQAQREQVASEIERADKLRKICDGKHPDIEAKSIRENWTVEKTELEVLRANRPTTGPYINTGAGENVTSEIIAAAAARSGGVSEKVAFDGLDDKGKTIASSKALRGIGMHQIMAMCAQEHGIQLKAGRIDDDAIRSLFVADQRSIQAASGAGFSTIGLSLIFENVQNKAMLDSYANIASTIQEIAYETDTNDFKAYVRYRITGSGALAEIGPAGEIHNVGLQDAKFSNQLKTVAGLLAITRQMMINDEMGALMQGPNIFGRMAAQSREKMAYTALLANTGSFFHANNSNLLTGGSSALSLTSLASAEKLLMEQKDDNGAFVGLMADRIIVPPALKTVALNLFNGNNLIASAMKLPAQTSGSSAAQAAILEPNVNAFANKYRPVVSPYLGTASPLTGNSDTAWYLLPSPGGGGAVLQIGYLRGQRTPTIERGEVNFNQLGIAMRCYWDLGVALFDPRAGVKSDGA